MLDLLDLLGLISTDFSNAKFVKCDVRDWDQQVAIFDAALAYSPHKSIDVVIANAGVVGADDLNNLDGKYKS